MAAVTGSDIFLLCDVPAGSRATSPRLPLLNGPVPVEAEGVADLLAAMGS